MVVSVRTARDVGSARLGFVLERVAHASVGPARSFVAMIQSEEDAVIMSGKDVLSRLQEEKGTGDLFELVCGTVEAYQKLWLSGSSSVVGLTYCLIHELSCLQLDAFCHRMLMQLFLRTWERALESLVLDTSQLFQEPSRPDAGLDDVSWFLSESDTLASIQSDEQPLKPVEQRSFLWLCAGLQHGLPEDSATYPAITQQLFGIPMKLAAQVAESLGLFPFGWHSPSSRQERDICAFKPKEIFDPVSVLTLLGSNTPDSRVILDSAPLPPLDIALLARLLKGGQRQDGVYHRVVCINAPLLPSKLESSKNLLFATVLRSASQFEEHHRALTEYVQSLTHHLHNRFGADLVLCAESVDTALRHSLEGLGVKILECLDASILKNLAKVCGAQACRSVWDLSEADCGVEVQIMCVRGGWSYDAEQRLTKTPGPPGAGAVGCVRGLLCARRPSTCVGRACTVIIAAPTACVCTDLEIRFWSCLQRLACATRQGVVVGGGAPEALCAVMLHGLATTLESVNSIIHTDEDLRDTRTLGLLGVPPHVCAMLQQDLSTPADLLDLSVGLVACANALERFVRLVYGRIQGDGTSCTPWDDMAKCASQVYRGTQREDTVTGKHRATLEAFAEVQRAGLPVKVVEGCPTCVLDALEVKLASVNAAASLVVALQTISTEVWS